MHKKDDYILQNIANHLIINCSFSKNIGLLYGTMGIIIFFYHYARYSKNRVYEEFAETLLNDFAEQIHSHLPIDFENGYLGIGWGIKYLGHQKFINEENINTLNSAYIECPSNDLIMYAIDSLFNSENYCIKISSEEYNDPEFYNFINIIRESFSGDCIPCNETANKPFIFKPILRLNDNFHKLESEDRIIEGHNILYYLNELSLYITDLCTLQCHHCADYNKQVLFCRKGNASADFPFKELDKILLHLSTSNIAKINFLGGNIFQYKYMQELINTIGEYRFKSHFFTHIEHINKHSVEIIKKY